MSNCSTNRFLIQHSLKYEKKEPAIKESKRILSFIEYQAKKENWTYRVIVAISNKASLSGIWIKEKKRTPGRPKYKFKPYEWVVKQKKEYNVKYHIHIIVEGNPGSTIANAIQNSINQKVEQVLGKRPNTFAKSIPGKFLEKAYLKYLLSQDPQPKIWGDDKNKIFTRSWREMIKNFYK